MTQPGRSRLRPGHWLLLGVVALLVVGVVFVVLHRDRSQPESQPTSASIGSSSSAAGPVCQPKVSETGYSDRDAAITFGLTVTSDFAALNLEVAAQAVLQIVDTYAATDAEAAASLNAAWNGGPPPLLDGEYAPPGPAPTVVLKP